MKKSHLNLFIVSAVFVMSMFILVACQKEDVTSNVVVEATPTSTEPAPTTRPPYPNGFTIPKADKRPVAVMIDNQGERPLPQGGLHKAEVIYEALAEGGITRYMPVFWNNLPGKIGPVRSSRHYFVDYALEHNAIYVHIGWSPQATAEISRYHVNNINGLYDSIFHKITTDRYNWQDKYTSGKKIMSYATKNKKYKVKNTKKMVFNYEKDVKTPTRGKYADSLYISYNTMHNCKYVFNPSKRVYYRWRMGKKHMERASGKQLSAGNIIIQYCANTAIADDKKNRQELYNIGSGKGWYITMGRAVKIKWSKASATAPTVYKNASTGKRIVLNPAQTWVQVTPPSATVKIEQTKAGKAARAKAAKAEKAAAKAANAANATAGANTLAGDVQTDAAGVPAP